jgi:hypothetical protein
MSADTHPPGTSTSLRETKFNAQDHFTAFPKKCDLEITQARKVITS